MDTHFRVYFWGFLKWASSWPSCASSWASWEFLGEEALGEVALKMKTIYDLELKVKHVEARFTIMENIKTDMTAAVGGSPGLQTSSFSAPPAEILLQVR